MKVFIRKNENLLFGYEVVTENDLGQEVDCQPITKSVHDKKKDETSYALLKNAAKSKMD